MKLYGDVYDFDTIDTVTIMIVVILNCQPTITKDGH